jgi:hypothetical protein
MKQTKNGEKTSEPPGPGLELSVYLGGTGTALIIQFRRGSETKEILNN